MICCSCGAGASAAGGADPEVGGPTWTVGAVPGWAA